MEQLPRFWENLTSLESGLPFVVNSVQRVMDGRYHVEKASVHDEFELVYVKKANHACFEISKEKVYVQSKDLLLIKPRQPHKLDVSSDKACEFMVLKFIFSKNDKSKIFSVSLEDFLNFINDKETGGYIRIGQKHRDEIVHTLGKIILESQNKKEDSDFLCSILMMEIFILLSRSLKSEWENSINKKGDKMQEIMLAAKDFIEENYAQDIGLTDISNYVYLSTSHFSRAFKKTFSISPIKHLLQVRIKHASELLIYTDLKIGDIAQKVGFSAQQRFNDIFKKQMGVSPSEYRAKYRDSIINK